MRSWKWPLVWRSTYDQLRRERNFLKDALKNANEELRKHRMIIADLRNGDFDVLDHVPRDDKKKAPRREPRS